MTPRVAGQFHHLNPTAWASQQRMASCGDRLGCCSLAHGWEGFGKAAFMWGQGQRGLQRQLPCLQWDQPRLPQASTCLTPAVSHTLWLSWLGTGREGRTARDQSWRHLQTLPDPQAGVRREAEQGQLRGPSRFLFPMTTLSASSVLWIPCKPQLLPRAKGWASTGTVALIVRTLCALSSLYPLRGNGQLHRHSVLWTASCFNSLIIHIVPPALDMMFPHPYWLRKPP